MQKKSAHTPEEKAAVLAALMAGQSVNAVAKEFKVSRPTIRRWRVAAGLVESMPMLNQQKAAEIGDLVIEYLRTMLATLTIQAEFFRNTKWLSKQSAAEVATLHGVSFDKAARILEALESTEPGP